MALSKMIPIGQMITQIKIIREIPGQDEAGYPTIVEALVFTSPVRCKWVNVHGREIYDYMAINMEQTATLTMLYSPKITDDMFVKKVGDESGEKWRIISIDNIEDANRYTELKVERIKPS